MRQAVAHYTPAGSIAEAVLISISSKETVTTVTPPESVLWPRFLLSTLPIITTNIIATGITAAKVWYVEGEGVSTSPADE